MKRLLVMGVVGCGSFSGWVGVRGSGTEITWQGTVFTCARRTLYGRQLEPRDTR